MPSEQMDLTTKKRHKLRQKDLKHIIMNSKSAKPEEISPELRRKLTDLKDPCIKVEEVYRVEIDGRQVGGMYDFGYGLHQKKTGRHWIFPKELYRPFFTKKEDAIKARKQFHEYYYRLCQRRQQKFLKKKALKDSSILKPKAKFLITVPELKK